MDFSNSWKHCYRFIHASFHTVYNCTWPTAISSVTISLHYLQRCLWMCSTVTCGACFQWFQINSDCTPKQARIRTMKTGRSLAGGQWCPDPISCLAPRLLHTSNIAFKKCWPPCGFCPPCCKILATDLNKNPENLCYEHKHMSVLIWFKTIIKYWFNYISSCKFSSATQTLNIWKTFFVAQDVFHNVGNVLRWWYLSLIVGVRLLSN